MTEFPPDKWIVDQILPAGELHIVGGPSGAGKTTWLMQFLTEWSAGRPIFGYDSRPGPFIYVSLDRGEPSFRRTLRRLGIDPDTFPYICGLSSTKPVGSFEDVLELVKTKFSGKLEGVTIVIEGISTLLPPKAKAIDYNQMFRFFAKLSAYCNELGITIIGVMHSPKMKETEMYLNPRQRILHSVAIGGVVETIILVEPDHRHPIDKKRIITVLPRNAPEQEFQMNLDGNGMLRYDPKAAEEAALAAEEDAGGKATKAGEILNVWLLQAAVGYVFTTSYLTAEMNPLGVSRRSVFNWVNLWELKGKVECVSHGLYRKLAPKPAPPDEPK
jgi:AAA domain